MTDSAPQYFVIVSSPDNWKRTEDRGFTIHGFKKRSRRKAEQMKPGDKLVPYITGEKQFGGVFNVLSTFREELDNPIWVSDMKKPEVGEAYPFRVDIEKEIWLPEADRVEAEPIAHQMEYTQRWPAKNWTLAFQGNVHQISDADYALIRDALEAAGK